MSSFFLCCVDSQRRTADGRTVNDVREIYRIQLPGNPIIGEGKPENQNHAIIFTRGEMIQAIDMNQAGYFEEALKMRNLLRDFDLYVARLILAFSVSLVLNPTVVRVCRL